MARFPITFHPEIFQILGEQLVSNPVIAIQELVKNAYDAESPSCNIYINTKKEEITIEDFGHGMDESSIEHGWLNIGTSIKRDSVQSKNKKRYLTGSMGIGRLSAFTLGDVTEIITTAEDKITRKFRLVLSEIRKLESLQNYYVEVKEYKENRNLGTIIKVSNLKIKFDETLKERLLRMLSILVVPNKKDVFDIKLTYDNIKTNIDPNVQLAHYQIKVICKVDEIGLPKINILSDKNSYLGTKDLLFKPKLLLHKYLDLKNVTIDLNWYMHGSVEGKSFWKETTSEFSKDMRSGLSGIRIYRDGIRVLPYGEVEDDSFNIEKEYISQGSKSKRPRKVQLIGWIYISRVYNPYLIDTSNREGLVNNISYKQLYNLLQEVIGEFIKYRLDMEEVQKEDKITLSDTKKVKEQINTVKKQITLLTKREEELPKNITHQIIQKRVNSNIEQVEKYVEKVDEILDVQALYRDKITAGNMINNIFHYVGAATKSSKAFIEIAQEQKCDISSHEVAFNSIMNLLPRIIATYDVLKGGSSGSEKKKKFNILNKTIALVENLRITSSMRSDQFIVHCQNIEVNMRESDYWAVIANLLLNAITCQDYEQAIGKKFPPKNERKIILTISKLNNDLIIQCEDNGPGLPEKPLGWIWQQFTTTRTPGGSGLGLFIISEIVTYYSGMKIASSSKSFPTGAHFYVQLKDVIE
ncbi:hypothetical protein A3K78_09135 [Candidatus Bathyarchaeota archaeon RBG_13_52_12]|nr:MAG: hypothetical protein A3K78_09135 [Candidatus Bathyarchaeota archaeon RBG_13_52_12]